MKLLFPVVEVTRSLSNLIKYQFVNLKDQDTVVINPQNSQGAENFVKKESRIKIRPLEEIEREERERALHPEEEEKEADDFSAGVPVVNYDEMLEKKEEEAEEKAKQLLLDARMESADVVSKAEEDARIIREEAREEGLEKGRQEGMELAGQEIDRIRSELEEERARLLQEYQSMVDELEPRYVDVLCSLLQKLTGVFLDDSKDVLLHLIRSSISDMEPSSRYTIRVSQEDAIIVEGHRTEISNEVGGAVVEVQEEKGLAKDECIIEADRQMVDCGFKTQLDNLLTTLRMLVQER